VATAPELQEYINDPESTQATPITSMISPAAPKVIAVLETQLSEWLACIPVSAVWSRWLAAVP